MELQSQELDSGILGISFVRPNGQCRCSADRHALHRVDRDPQGAGPFLIARFDLSAPALSRSFRPRLLWQSPLSDT
jgi:hypothetical protein